MTIEKFPSGRIWTFVGKELGETGFVGFIFLLDSVVDKADKIFVSTHEGVDLLKDMVQHYCVLLRSVSNLNITLKGGVHL